MDKKSSLSLPAQVALSLNLIPHRATLTVSNPVT